MTRIAVAGIFAFGVVGALVPGRVLAQISYVCQHGRPANDSCPQCSPNRASAGSRSRSDSDAPADAPDPAALIRRAYELNRKAMAASRTGDWAAAVVQLREALALDPSNDTITQNHAKACKELARMLEAEAKQRAEKARLDAEWSDAFQRLQSGIKTLGQNLLQLHISGDRDGGPAAAVGASASGRLAFIPFVDSSVVDLRDSQTDIVDPAKVRGEAPTDTALNQWRLASASGDKSLRDKARVTLRETTAAKLAAEKERERKRWERARTVLEPQRRELEAAYLRIQEKAAEDLEALADQYEGDFKTILAVCDPTLLSEKDAREMTAAVLKDAYAEEIRRIDDRTHNALRREFRRIMSSDGR